MSTAYDDRPDMTVPARQALSSADIESARFAVGLRGYRMDEVDTLLERVAKEVAERDRRIADLERAVAPIVDAPDGAGFTSRGVYIPTDFDDTGVQKPIMVGGDFPEPDTAEHPVVAQHADSAEESAAAQPGATEAEEPRSGAAAAGAPPAAGQAPGAADPSAAAAQPGATQPGAVQPGAGAADEYERLQAEARALLDAQAQPRAPRRTPAERQPAPQPRQTPPPPPPAPGPEQPESALPEADGEAWYQQPAPEQLPADAPNGPQRSAPPAGSQPAPTPHWVLPDPAPQHEQQAPPERGAYQRPN